MAYQIAAIAQTHPGQVRKVNEDSVLTYIRPPDQGDALGLMIVADGIGGHKAGDIASKLAIDTIQEYLTWFLDKDDSEDTKPIRVQEDKSATVAELASTLEIRLKKAIEAANRSIITYADSNPQSAGNLGTTLTCLLIWGENLVLAHVGDSRAYRLRNGQFQQLSEDHSFVGEMVRDGQLPPEAFYDHPRRNVITRALGQIEDIEIDLWSGDIQVGDKFLLCSDGLWEMVRNPEIEHLLASKTDIDKVAKILIEKANQNGGPDNISVVIGEIVRKHDGK